MADSRAGTGKVQIGTSCSRNQGSVQTDDGDVSKGRRSQLEGVPTYCLELYENKMDYRPIELK